MIHSTITLTIAGGGKVTLNELQEFIDHARAMNIPPDEPLETSLTAPYEYDQRDRSPGSFSVVATAPRS